MTAMLFGLAANADWTPTNANSAVSTAMVLILK
jgi:hypothetical protein